MGTLFFFVIARLFLLFHGSLATQNVPVGAVRGAVPCVVPSGGRKYENISLLVLEAVYLVGGAMG